MSRSLIPVNRIGVEERAATLGHRSIKTTAKRQGILLATSMIDLTTLEGADTPGKVRHLCAKAVCPDPRGPRSRPCAAVCVYPSLVDVAAEALRGTGVAVASVSTGFPAGQTSLEVKVEETREAVAAGATRDRHGDLARGVPERRRRARRARDRGGQGGVRRGAPEGHPRDRRAADLRARAPRLPARDRRRRRRDQDLDRQGADGRHARASCWSCSRPSATTPSARARSSASRRRAASAPPRRRCTCSCWSRRRWATSG